MRHRRELLSDALNAPRNALDFVLRLALNALGQEYLSRLRWPEGFQCPKCADTTPALPYWRLVGRSAPDKPLQGMGVP